MSSTFVWQTALALSILLAAPEAHAQSWPEGGAGFEWETVGETADGRGLGTRGLVFDADGRLWAASGSGPHRLDDPDAPGALWTPLPNRRLLGSDAVLPLGRGDTTVSGDVDTRRTVDAGKSWQEVSEFNAISFLEVPQVPGLPADLRAGHLLAGLRQDGLARSTDRGATWESVPGIPPGHNVSDLLILPPGHPHAGRLLVDSDDYRDFIGVDDGNGGLAVEETADSRAYPTRTLERMELMPSGRLIATGFFQGGGQNVAFVSDDGGETWRQTVGLPEPNDGIPGTAEIAVIGPATALAVGGRGIVYRTDDDGKTWAVVGRAPIFRSDESVQSILVEPGGRVYLGVVRSGSGPFNPKGWVYRTASAVTVARARPPEASGSSLRVSPNPASGAVRIALESPEPSRVTVFDARGREVWASGAHLARGDRSWEVDTSVWASGVYVVRAEVGGDVLAAQVVVAR